MISPPVTGAHLIGGEYQVVGALVVRLGGDIDVQACIPLYAVVVEFQIQLVDGNRHKRGGQCDGGTAVVVAAVHIYDIAVFGFVRIFDIRRCTDPAIGGAQHLPAFGFLTGGHLFEVLKPRQRDGAATGAEGSCCPKGVVIVAYGAYPYEVGGLGLQVRDDDRVALAGGIFVFLARLPGGAGGHVVLVRSIFIPLPSQSGGGVGDVGDRHVDWTLAGRDRYCYVIYGYAVGIRVSVAIAAEGHIYCLVGGRSVAVGCILMPLVVLRHADGVEEVEGVGVSGVGHVAYLHAQLVVYISEEVDLHHVHAGALRQGLRHEVYHVVGVAFWADNHTLVAVVTVAVHIVVCVVRAVAVYLPAEGVAVRGVVLKVGHYR